MEIVHYDPEPYTDMILHYSSCNTELKTKEFSVSGQTPWSQEFGKEKWFKPHCVIYRRRLDRFVKVLFKGKK